AKADQIVYRQTPVPASVAGTGSTVGQRFPDFSMVDMDGKTVRLSDFRGRPVVVNFFQAWCPYCIEEFAVWRATQPRYGDKVVVLPVIYGVSDAAWLHQSAKIKRYGVPIYGVAVPPVAFYGIPQNWFLDKDGVVLERTRALAAHLVFERLDKAVK